MESGVPKYFLLTLIVMTILVLLIPVLLFYYLPDMVIMLYLPWVCISTWMVEKMESILYKSNKDSKVIGHERLKQKLTAKRSEDAAVRKK